MIPEVEEVPPRRRAFGFDALALVGCSAVVFVAAFLMVRPDGRVARRSAPDRPLGETCNSVKLFGVRCPACGLTRSFVLSARGDLTGAFHYHTLGPILFLLTLAQIPYRAARIARPSWGGVPSSWEQAAVGILVLLGFLIWLAEGIPTGFRPV